MGPFLSLVEIVFGGMDERGLDYELLSKFIIRAHKEMRFDHAQPP
jgi:hypothetical protein